MERGPMSDDERERRGGELVTRWEAERIMMQGLSDYELKVVNPRHLETQQSLGTLKNMFWGIVLLCFTILGGIITVLAKHS